MGAVPYNLAAFTITIYNNAIGNASIFHEKNLLRGAK
jgi:hypothetical protein